MINFVEILNNFDKYNHIHLKTISILENIKDFHLIKNWLLEKDKLTHTKILFIKQTNDFTV